MICWDCGEDTSNIGEYYMVNDAVWKQAVENKKAILCIGCLEARLNRRLTPDDFSEKLHLPINNIEFQKTCYGFKVSDRILRRRKLPPFEDLPYGS